MNRSIEKLSSWQFAIIVIICMLSNGAANAQTTTIITHGFTSDKDTWVEGMTRAIITQAGSGSAYRYNNDTGMLDYISAQSDGSDDHIVIILNWEAEAGLIFPPNGPNWKYAQAAGDAFVATLLDPSYSTNQGPANLTHNRTLHIIGHSRGNSVNSFLIHRLGDNGVAVDQMTMCDPVPVTDWGDVIPVKWSNVTWADNYYRQDNDPFDFNGRPIDNVFNIELDDDALFSGYTFEHSDTHLWYHGTIDTRDTINVCDGITNDDGICLTPAMRSSWYAEFSAMTHGFYFTSLGSGYDQRPPQPDGMPLGATQPILLHGDFERGTYAGWRYHGGGWDRTGSGGFIAETNNDFHAQLGNVPGNSDILSFQHNRFFLPENMTTLQFGYRLNETDTNDSDDILIITLNAVNDTEPAQVIGMYDLSDSNQGNDWVDTSLFIPSELRGRQCLLHFSLMAGNTVDAQVDIDDIDFANQAAMLLSASFIRGSLLSGDVNNLARSDDITMRGRSQFGFLSSEPNVLELQIDAITHQTEVNAITLLIESQCNNPNAAVTLQLRNQQSGSFETVHSYTLSTQELFEQTDVTGSVASYVDFSTGNVELRVKHVVIATFSLSGFISTFDHIEIAVNEN